jgi:succinate dehydrogenase / fumarate reductase membrane anchor subunit
MLARPVPIKVQVVIEEYVHGELLKVFLIMLNIFFPLVVGAASIFAIVRIAFGA